MVCTVDGASGEMTDEPRPPFMAALWSRKGRIDPRLLGE